jgi:hypothetical protein
MLPAQAPKSDKSPAPHTAPRLAALTFLMMAAQACSSVTRGYASDGPVETRPALTSTQLTDGTFSGRYKLQCDQGPEGCACTADSSPESTVVARFRHASPVQAAHPTLPPAGLTGTTEITTPGGQSCHYPSRELRPIYWENTLCPDPEGLTDIPFPSLSELLTEDSAPSTAKPIGLLFPTFYNIADESFHEGEPSEKLLETGTLKEIARVTPSYRTELDIQGTGRLRDGRVINVADRVNGQWRYKVLAKGEYGHGIAGHRIHPFRSAAVDFLHICQKGGFDFCALPIEKIREKLVGTLLHIPRLVGAKMPSGAIHDGYVCAQDIGGAIREDRIDLFVGPAGAGNPYLPECRMRNGYIDHGVASLNPTDWPTVQKTGVDAEGRTTYKRAIPLEYRTASPEKGLEARIVPGAKCRP